MSVASIFLELASTLQNDAASAQPTEPPHGHSDRFYRFSIEQYHRMARSEIFLSDDRLELIEGIVVRKMTKHTPHIVTTDYLTGILVRAVPDGWFVSLQNPITISESSSEPEPDAMVVRGTPRDYEDRRVGPADVGLVVEVSDSSLRDDQVTKKSIYAHASIAIYWIVNIPARRVEVYTDPTGPDPTPDYRRRLDFSLEAQLPLVLDGIAVAHIVVADILPRK